MEDTEEYRDAFSLFDKKGDGRIDCGQIGDVLRALGLNPTESDVKKIVNDIDPSGEKRISFDEFLPIYHTNSKKSPKGTWEDFVEGLKIFDREGNGLISAAEIRHCLTSLGEKLTDDEVEILLQGQEDSSGKVMYEEFIRNVMNG